MVWTSSLIGQYTYRIPSAPSSNSKLGLQEPLRSKHRLISRQSAPEHARITEHVPEPSKLLDVVAVWQRSHSFTSRSRALSRTRNSSVARAIAACTASR